ncbi:hypothetical protein GCM10007094_23300 [Pseudovibrio japonicus]|uniref:Uncharacterized protein n=1 Tax=Pseudovibrio japonicus TaxID=366534 RepID=A0ABQ3EGB5_9HYPH|nr:hypothetical protein [Pseudovibrio japonicus]GHB33779.1 hypothetical protein GCM10007094_23300 [Pseudovibrio japonicus]
MSEQSLIKNSKGEYAVLADQAWVPGKKIEWTTDIHRATVLATYYMNRIATSSAEETFVLPAKCERKVTLLGEFQTQPLAYSPPEDPAPLNADTLKHFEEWARSERGQRTLLDVIMSALNFPCSP